MADIIILQHVSHKKNIILYLLHDHNFIIPKVFNNGTIMSNIQSIFRCLQLPNSASNQGLCIAIDIVSLNPSLIYNSLLIYRSQHFHLHKVQDNGLESYNLDLCDDFPLSILTILIKNVMQTMIHTSHFIIQKDSQCQFVL